jgi:hypothetical protein
MEMGKKLVYREREDVLGRDYLTQVGKEISLKHKKREAKR